MTSGEQRREIDAFDYLRTHVVVSALTELLEGSSRPVHEILHDAYIDWQYVGDTVRPPEDMSGPEAALKECYAVLDIVSAMLGYGLDIDAPAGCRAVEPARPGPPDGFETVFCDACRTNHVVFGPSLEKHPDAEPALRPEAPPVPDEQVAADVMDARSRRLPVGGTAEGLAGPA